MASSVGATATMVAAARAIASREPDAIIDDPFAEPLVRAVGMDFFIRLLDGEFGLSDDDGGAATRLMTNVMAVRTRFFDDFFTDAAAAGVRQAVILASGLDARAYRLPWPAGTVVYEIDQPKVIEFKNATMADLGAEPDGGPPRGRIDLRDDWPKALRRQRLRFHPADRLDRGRTAHLPSAGGAGSAVRQDRRAQRARQPGRHRAHPRRQHVLRRAVAADLGSAEAYGHDIEMGDLIYHENAATSSST